MKRFANFSRYVVLPVIVALLTISPSLFADGGANHQVANTSFGVSGGNINDRSSAFCCSGTLGSLVRDGSGKLYILSNNHVLARSDQAVAGEDISQPGMIDVGCRVPPIVADFSAAPALGTNVDAAVAALRSGEMNTSGAIEDIGTISNVVKNPTVGLAVAKSGRTTGFTTGTIGSVSASISVQYQKGCNQGKKFTVRYTNQVVINSGTFSAGGDSGSLIVTDDSCHQPVALLYAGSSSTTIGNPIGEVLNKVTTALGQGPVTFVGTACGTTTSKTASANRGVSDEAIDFATSAMRSRENNIMAKAGVIGIGVGSADDNAGEAIIVVYVDATSGAAPSLPRRINGVRVKRVYTEPFVAR